MSSWIEINQNSFEHNINNADRLISIHTALGIVIKANGYGHGLREMAQLAEQNMRCTWLLVATLEEALLLRTWGCVKNILVMAYHDTNLIKDALYANIVMSVTDLYTAEVINKVAIAHNQRARVHIKIDVGMHRLGLMPHELSSIFGKFPFLAIEGLYAHLGITNSTDRELINQALDTFDRLCTTWDPHKKFIHHIGASGLLWHTGLKDMVRVGTFAYGSWKSPIQQTRVQNKSNHDIIPIMSWKTSVMHIKHIEKGDYVGYDQAFCASRPMRIAILPVGYADGYPRALSNKGVVLVQEHYAPIIGLISMNMMAIDISEIGAAQRGSEVTLIGPHKHITPSELAFLTHTNPNDITTGIHPHIIRQVVQL